MPVSFDQFAAAVVAGYLTPEEDLRAAIKLLETAGRRDVHELARALVLDKKLTKYQAQQIYQGKANGLTLGQYTVLEPLGQGGMGQVFKARHRVMQRVVALKVLSPAAMKSPDAVQRFHREVRAAARLTHPHIVTAFDADQAGGTHYLVMECVDGQDLESLCRQHGRLPVPEAINYMLQAAEGLAYAHTQGVIHRDIKPHNLLLDRNGTLKILDMGLARLVDGTDVASVEGLTQSGIVMGTIDYMSPEQAEDTHGVDARADIYSLGCTLFRLLAGRTPYAGDTVLAKLMGHAKKPVPALRDERDDVSQELSDVVRRMMAKHPHERYQSIDELTTDLKACAAGLKPVASRPAASMFAEDDPLTGFLADLYNSAPASPTRASVPAKVDTRRSPSRRNDASVAMAPANLSEKIWQAQATHPVLCYGGLGGIGMIVGVLLVALWTGGSEEPTNMVTDVRPSTPVNKPWMLEAPPVEPIKPTKPVKPGKTSPLDPVTEASLRSLAERVRASSGDPGPLTEELRTILQNHTGTSAATRAGELLALLLARSPSALDPLQALQVPADVLQFVQVVTGKPAAPELIGVVGELRGRQFGGIRAVAASRDGKRLASAGNYGQVYLWDAHSLRLERVLTMPRVPLQVVAFAPNGQLAVASDDFKIYLWDLTTKDPPRACDHKARLTSLAYTSDGQALVSAGGSDGRLRVWNPQTGAELREFTGHQERVLCVAAVPESSDFVSLGESGKVLRWNAGTGMISAEMQHPGSANSLAVSLDGATLLTGGAEGQVVRWDLSSGKELNRSPAQGAEVRRLVALPGERAASCTADGKLQIWDVKSWRQLHMAGRHVGQVHGLCVLPDRPTLATSSDDGLVRLWSTDTLQEQDPPTGHVGPISNIKFTLSNQVILTRGQDRTLRAWRINPMPAREESKLEDVNALERDNCLALYRNGRALAFNVQSNTVRLDQFTAPVLEKGTQFEVAGIVTALAWSPVRRQLAVAVLEVSGSSVVQMWSPEESGPQRTKTLGRDTGAISSLSFSPDGQRLALARMSGALAIWDLAENQQLLEQKGSWPVSATSPCLVKYSPDGTLLGFAEPGFIRLLRADNLQKVFEKDLGTGNVVSHSAAFTPDGQYFICGGRFLNSGCAYCVAVRQAELVHYFDVPSPVSSVDVASDGRHFAAADGNGTVYVFRLDASNR